MNSLRLSNPLVAGSSPAGRAENPAFTAGNVPACESTESAASTRPAESGTTGAHCPECGLVRLCLSCNPLGYCHLCEFEVSR
jgi:hypothetical protein